MANNYKEHPFWQRLTGNPTEFSLEARIFHSICVIAIIALAYNVPFNYYIDLPNIALLSFFMLLVFSFLYYRSRYQHKMKSSVIACGIVAYLLFFINYYFNSGINGPSFLFFGLSFYLVIAITPKRQHWIWMSVNVMLVMFLFIAEYNNPNFIVDNYTSTENRFTDIASAYVVTVTLVYFSIAYIKNNYEFERNSAQQKAIDIEKQHQQILLQNQQLEHLNTEKNKLFSIVAHDLRSPLSSIQSYLELLSEFSLEEEEKKSINKSLLMLTKNTSNMMSNLLSWSKTQMEGVIVKQDLYSLYRILYNTLQVEKEIAFRKGISLKYEISESIQLTVDSDMLQLVVRNLISNAIKFTSNGGEILFKLC